MKGIGTQTIEKPDVDLDSKVGRDWPWNVIVWNDSVNLMSYVVFVFQRVFGYSRELATRLMLEVHRGGKTVVATEARERAEFHIAQLHGYGLQATLQKQEG